MIGHPLGNCKNVELRFALAELEDALQFHEVAHVALTLELPGHEGCDRIKLAVRDGHPIVFADSDDEVCFVSRAFAPVNFLVCDGDVVFLVTLDVHFDNAVPARGGCGVEGSDHGF